MSQNTVAAAVVAKTKTANEAGLEGGRSVSSKVELEVSLSSEAGVEGASYSEAEMEAALSLDGELEVVLPSRAAIDPSLSSEADSERVALLKRCDDANHEADQTNDSPKMSLHISTCSIGCDAANCATGQESAEQANDPVFKQEQLHLTATHEKLVELGKALELKMEKTRAQAAADKESMADEVSIDLSTDDDAMETYADFLAMNSIIRNYNIMQDADAKKLADIQLLLRQPYFAKVALRFKPGAEPREFYIGNAGISDENCRRMIVDWRSPVAETYYNQDNGMTSYVADGRTITAELTLRRQFDVEGAALNGYFDTTIAIQDALLLASLSKRRTAQMQAITATIQREQNQVVRHADVPVLLVNGIAGSGKTSVLLQRIAYLFYQQRESLDPREVFLVTPNPLFGRYIDGVLPDMGERNPNILTYDEFMRALLPDKTGAGKAHVSPDALRRIDEACARFEFEPEDFCDIVCDGEVLVPAHQIRKIDAKYRNVAAGPHRVTLVREEVERRLEARLKQLAAAEAVQDEMYALSIEEQLRIFHEVIDAQTEAEEKALALQFLQDRFACAPRMVERDEWLRIDRIGRRLLGNPSMTSVEWLYLKMLVTGLCDPTAKYVMVDEVQDYTVAQLTVLARYFRRAHFLLLGDPNQAISSGTATFDEMRQVFAATHGEVETCSLMTSYRSSPEITAVFARLAGESERMQISSVQREGVEPRIQVLATAAERDEALRTAVSQALERSDDGLTAVVAPYEKAAKKLVETLRNVLPESSVTLLDELGKLPESGVVVMPLKLAKGLEFDRVIVPDASERVFPCDDLSRRRLYTTVSRATREVTLLAVGGLTPLLG